MTAVSLDNVLHADVRVAVRHGATFGDAVNQMLLVPTEILEAAREFPVLLRQGEEGWHAVALLGFDPDENLFLSKDRWRSRYVPAVQRRGPFVIGVDKERAAAPEIRLVTSDPRVGDGAGLPLFLPHGGEAPYLAHVRDALATLHVGVTAAPAMFAAFAEAGLLASVDLDIEVDDDRHYVIDDCWTIDAARLDALDGATLAALNAQGHLAIAFAIVSSLGNIQHLIDLKRGVAAQ